MNISATDDLEDATDEEREPSRQNRHSNREVSFFRRTKCAKTTGKDYLVVSEKRYDRLVSYLYYRWDDTTANNTSTTTTRLHRSHKTLS